MLAEEMLNNTSEDMDEGFDFFSDETEEETEPAAEDGATNAEEAEQPEEPAAENQSGEEAAEQPAEDEPKYTVKYNGQEQELPVSQLITLAQKGMNYDHVHDSYTKEHSAYEFLSGIAQRSNMTPEQYIEAYNKQVAEQQVQQNIQKGMPEEVAREYQRLREENEQLHAFMQSRQEEDKRAAEINAFRAVYPDVTSLPEEVIQQHLQTGESLVSAYTVYENKQLKQQLENLKQNQSNKARAVGSVSSNDGADNADLFLAGWGAG